MTFDRRALIALLLIATAATARAQCPDGAPPPCKGGMPAALRRVNPPLDTRAWIVVPFGNVMKAPELDWLRDASVNLLSLDLGRWTDIRVVPDKRVGDLVRELPAARSAEALTLNDGLAIARRAGAGMLVMGDFFRLGKGARLVANVFDVRTGAKLRSAVQQTLEQDSLLTSFTPLARSVLAVPPPADARMGDLGTSNLDAYQAYLLGVKAFNRDDMLEARRQLTRALAIDSSFALAHFQLSAVLAWGESDPNGGETRAHSLAAARLGTHLPPRERSLIDAQVAYARSDFTKACDIVKPLVARDSMDIQALVAFGECSFHDNAVELSATDTTVGTYKGNWNTALRAFTRVLQLDPSYHVAFEHVVDILRATNRGGCSRRVTGAPCRSWSSGVLRSGDTLELVAVSPNSDAYFRQLDRAAKEQPQLVNLGLARGIAQNWLDSDTTSERAHHGMGLVLLSLGDVPGAHAHFSRISMRAMRDNAVPIRNRMEAAAKLGRGVEARALFDSLVKAIPDFPSVMMFRGAMDLMYGHLKRFDDAVTTAVSPYGPEAIAYHRQLGRALLGLPRAELGRDEIAWFRAMSDSGCDRDCRVGRLTPSLSYALGAPRTAWPDTNSKVLDGRLSPAVALAIGDTVALRAASAKLERDARRSVQMGRPEGAWSVIAADGYLMLRDTSAALRMTRFFVDTAMPRLPIATTIMASLPGRTPIVSTPIWPRMMLLRADLAAATGNREEAKLWYDRVLDLWSTADAELQPVVDRIRKSRAALGKGN